MAPQLLSLWKGPWASARYAPCRARLSSKRRQRGAGTALPEQAEGAQPVFRGAGRLPAPRRWCFRWRGCGARGSAAILQQGNKGVEIAGLAGVLPGLAQIDKDGVPVEGVDPLGVPGGDGVQTTGPSKWTGSQVGSISQWSRNRKVCSQISPARARASAAACGHCRRTAAAASARAGPEHRSCVHTRSPPFRLTFPDKAAPGPGQQQADGQRRPCHRGPEDEHRPPAEALGRRADAPGGDGRPQVGDGVQAA